MSKYHYERDYSDDSLRWIRKISERMQSNPFSKAEGEYRSENLEKLQNEIIGSNDSALAYFFTTEFNYKPHRMQKIILDNKNAKYAFLFAQNIPNADIKALQKVVVGSGEIKYIYKFACFVKGADRRKLQSIILKSKNVKGAHTLLKNVEGAKVEKFKDIILDSGRPRYLYELAKHLDDPEEIARIEDLIIEAGSFMYIRLFADKIKQANIEKLEQAVLDSNNMEQIKKFAKYVKSSKMKRFFLVL